MKQRKIFLTFVLIFCVSINILLLCSCGKEKVQEDKVIKIGAILNLTGSLAQADEPKKLDLIVAEEEINASGGIAGKKLQLVFEDGKSTPKDNIDAFNKLWRDGIKIIVTGTSVSAMPILPLTEAKGVLHGGAVGTPSFTENTRYSIRCFPNVKLGSGKICDYLINSNIKSIFIMHTNEPYGQSYGKSLTDCFIGKGGKVLGSEEFIVGQKDVKDILLKIKTINPERIVLIGFGITFPTIFRQSIEYKLTVPYVVNETFYKGEYDTDIMNSDLFNKIVFLAPEFIDTLIPETSNEFVKLHRKKFGTYPQIFGVYSSDFLKILQTAITEKNIDDNNKIVADIMRIKVFQAYTGQVEVTNEREINYLFKYYRYDNGKLTKL